MYNKIASIILNSGKNNNYAGEVFVSQPDSNKERLAGKIFVLAEIEGKKNETQKIINFLINIFDYNYYGDEKLLLRDKIEGLKIEDIFETVLAKVNQGLLDFLQEERLRINADNTNLTLGVIHEDKLYFSNYGKNKAFLIFRRKGDYEVINVESNAAEGEAIISEEFETDDNAIKGKVFSSVINGEIPAHSYFLFANEALPEYLSNREMINIITKLPPMVAAEQIKNFLQQINSFAPFLGVIVKSTIGTGLNDFSENRDENEITNQVSISNNVNNQSSASSRNANNSISHLNYTEQKTENMLAPAGIINLKKIMTGLTGLISKFKVEIPDNKKVVKFYDEEPITITTAPTKKDKKSESASRNSFIIKEKLFFRKKSYFSFNKLTNFLVAILVIFTPNFWIGVYQSLSHWLKTLGKKDRILVGALTACFLILVVSIIVGASGNKARLAAKQFDDTVIEVENGKPQVALYAAVSGNLDDRAIGTLNTLIDKVASSLPQNKEQEIKKATLLADLQDQSDKLQKITKVENFTEVVNANSWNAQAGADNLVFLNSQLYIADGLNKSIYNFNLKDASRNQITLTDSVPLTSPSINENIIYYLAGSNILKIAQQKTSVISAGVDKIKEGYLMQSYSNYFYILSKSDNQIYRYNKDFSSKTNWLKGVNDLSGVSDFKVDGSIYVSQEAGNLIKFHLGDLEADYSVTVISPAIRADKIVTTAGNSYLLDIKNNRLINFTKAGSLVKQYRLVKDGQIKDFAIDESSKTAYILFDTTVYKFAL